MVELVVAVACRMRGLCDELMTGWSTRVMTGTRAMPSIVGSLIVAYALP